MLVFFNPVKFGITFTLGNLMALGRFVFDSYEHMVSMCLIVDVNATMLVFLFTDLINDQFCLCVP